jgi:hypothetical protein
MTTTTTTSSRNIALTASRFAAGLLGTMQLVGAVYFLLISPDEAVWVGPWLDVPIVALLLSGVLLKLGVALLPGLPETRRITMGFLAVGIGTAVTIVKIPVYNEPEGVLFIVLDAVLLALLTWAWRAAKR